MFFHSTPIEYYNHSLKIARKAYKDDRHDEIIRPLCNLGKCCVGKKEFDNAIKYYEEGLEISQQIHIHKPHDNTALIFNRLGICYFFKENYAKAIEYYKNALEIRELIYQDNKSHPYIAASLINLAEAYYKNDQYDNAIKFCNRALQISKDNDGNHEQLLETAREITGAFVSNYSLDKQKILSKDCSYMLSIDTELLNTIEEYRSIIENNWFFDNLS